jgi:hypothetical protein
MFQQTQETQEILESQEIKKDQETQDNQDDQEDQGASNPESLGSAGEGPGDGAGEGTTAQRNEWSSDELIHTKEKQELTLVHFSAQPEPCLALSGCYHPTYYTPSADALPATLYGHSTCRPLSRAER